ncbi:MAG: phosphotriesterase-related protein [Chloroflexi bacterium]|nr:phosphotriesterase-related protein [Chloroflexota bacterium]
MTAMNDSGKVVTVTGAVPPDALGPTLTHEHLLIDFTVVYKEPDNPVDAPLARAKVDFNNLGWVRFNWVSNYDNLTLDDEALAIREASFFKNAGGGTIVDATTIGIGRNPEALKRISNATGLNVIMGAGFYVEASHSDEYAKRSVDDVARQIVTELTEGVDGTAIRCGIIGELGCSWPWTDDEKKTVEAAVLAQQETGAAILIHPGRNNRAPLEILEFMSSKGADLSRTIMGHIERTIFDPSVLSETAATGAYLEYDLFGHDSPYYPLAPETYMPGDHQRIDQIASLLDQGYGDRVVLAHDVCSKHRLREFGGHGWDHIISRVGPWMAARGVETSAFDRMLIDNPARVLTYPS